MRLLVLVCLLLPSFALGQTREVRPGELVLSVEVEDLAHTPFVREMVLITIKGIYRRHITLETLVQPDLEGFSWAQLGPDNWREERLDGALVKVFERRMAVYPDRAGTLTIGAFTHALTLTDEGDDWFEHKIRSEPVSIEVAPAPAGQGWWFPLRSLRIADDWSNAPDQLTPGEGVLRVVRLEALGATPEMIPPMPELTSPSAMIFPHPEKRLVELTPEGPVTYAFWRWTIRPSNDVSTIVEPLVFDYFNTRTREAHEVTISAQRVAYGEITGQPDQGQAPPPRAARLPGAGLAGLGLLVFALGLVFGLWGRRVSPMERLRRLGPFDGLQRQLRRAVRAGDPAAFRRAASALMRRDGGISQRRDLLRAFDRACFDPAGQPVDLKGFARAFRRARRAPAE